MSAPRASEFELIARHFAPLAGTRRIAAHSLTDDAASFVPRPGFDVVMTADAIVRGIHFLPDDPPALVARKALRVNLSDLAAKGAVPLCFLVCLALPRDIEEDWIAGFAAGLAADQQAYGIELAGGDTTSTAGDLVVAITALGEVPSGRMIRRSGGRPGDEVWLSGTVGDGALGLLAAQGRLPELDTADHDALVDRYRLPLPRIALGPLLVDLGVSCMDVSDGLVQDLGHLARLAGCGATIEAALLPLSTVAARLCGRDPPLLASALTGGDDYELLIVAPPSRAAALAQTASTSGTPLTRIGRFHAGEGVVVRDAAGERLVLPRSGWQHF